MSLVRGYIVSLHQNRSIFSENQLTNLCLSQSSFVVLKHFVLIQRRKSCEDAKYQLYRQINNPVCALLVEEIWMNSYSKKVLRQILYRGSIEARNVFMIPALSGAW